MIVKRIFSKALSVKNNMYWKKSAKKLRKETVSLGVEKPGEGKIIILMPHSDDEWIGCSQLIIHRSHNILVLNLDMCGGDDEYTHSVRRHEAITVSNMYHYELKLASNPIEDLIRTIVDYSPDFIFLPCYFDWHEEHIRVMNAFMSAADTVGFSGKVGMYQVSLPIPDEIINCGFPMSHKTWKEKWKLFKSYYPTQCFIPSTRFAIQEYINGPLANSYATEVYSIFEYGDWKQLFIHNQLDCEERQYYKQKLNDIHEIKSKARIIKAKNIG